MPRAPRCVSSALRPDIRLALSDCCFISRAVRQPNKRQQPLHARRPPPPPPPLLCDKRHVSPSPIHRSSTSHCCQGVDSHTDALTTAASREHEQPGRRLSSFLADRLLLLDEMILEIRNRTAGRKSCCLPPDRTLIFSSVSLEVVVVFPDG